MDGHGSTDGTIGVRYARGCHPDDLWTKYFTSSEVVQEYRWLYGEPDVIEVRQIFDSSEEAKEFEEMVLRDLNAVHDSKWLNIQNAGKTFNSEKSENKGYRWNSENNPRYWKDKKQLDELNQKRRKTILLKYATGKILKQTGRKDSEETRQKKSRASQGEKNGRYGKPVKESTRLKIGEANKGKLSGEKNPLYEKAKERFICCRCGKEVNLGNLFRWHNDKCRVEVSHDLI